MLEKLRLTESFIIQGKLDKVSSVDTKLIKNHILSNFTLDARYNDDQYWYMKDFSLTLLSNTKVAYESIDLRESLMLCFHLLTLLSCSGS